MLIHFYEFVRTGRAEDILTEDLNHAVEEKNMAIIYRSDYLRMREMQEELDRLKKQIQTE